MGFSARPCIVIIYLFYHPFLEQDLQLESPYRMISAILLLSYQLILFKNYLSIIYFLKGENSWKF